MPPPCLRSAHVLTKRCATLPKWAASGLRTAAHNKTCHNLANLSMGSCAASAAWTNSTKATNAALEGPTQSQQSDPQPAELINQPADVAADWLERTRLLVGDNSLKALEQTHVLLVGLGGVGSYAAEFLCRAGIGRMTIVDGDDVDVSNKNRQLHALTSTVSKPKAAIVAARLLDINPSLNLSVVQEFLQPGGAQALVTPAYHYVMDCIDSIAPKVEIIAAAHHQNIPVISAMGAGGRVDPSKVRIADISQTFNDPFASEIRRSLKKKGIHLGVTVVFSEELALRSSLKLTQGGQFKRSYFGTISFIPALFGLNAAAYVINDVVASAQGKQSPNTIIMNREHRRKALGLVSPYKKKRPKQNRAASNIAAVGGERVVLGGKGGADTAAAVDTALLFKATGPDVTSSELSTGQVPAMVSTVGGAPSLASSAEVRPMAPTVGGGPWIASSAEEVPPMAPTVGGAPSLASSAEVRPMAPTVRGAPSLASSAEEVPPMAPTAADGPSPAAGTADVPSGTATGESSTRGTNHSDRSLIHLTDAATHGAADAHLSATAAPAHVSTSNQFAGRQSAAAGGVAGRVLHETGTGSTPAAPTGVPRIEFVSETQYKLSFSPLPSADSDR